MHQECTVFARRDSPHKEQGLAKEDVSGAVVRNQQITAEANTILGGSERSSATIVPQIVPNFPTTQAGNGRLASLAPVLPD